MKNDIIEGLIDIVKETGSKILEIYERDDHGVEYKDDLSPLTLADKASNEIIVRGLEALTPAIPIISEENKEIPYDERKSFEKFWVVDPLDGTKEFIKRNGEFTINIGLIENGCPVLGVISIPVSGDIYYGIREEGAFYREGSGSVREIKVKDDHSEDDKLIAAVSRSHLSGKDEKVIAALNGETVPAGSALKFTLVAEGTADVYLRFGPTWEWDTAAGHAIARAAGSVVCDLDGDELKYNKKILKHGGFFVCSKGLKNRVFEAIRNV